MRRLCVILAALMLLTFFVPKVAASDEREMAHEIHEFTVGTDSEKPYLVKGGALNDSHIRFADAKAQIVYRFDLTNTINLRAVELIGALYQQLHLLVSSDGENFTEVYRWVGEIKPNGSGGLGMELRHFDLTPYLDLKNLETVYVKIADSYTSGGWGGAIHPSERVVLDVSYLSPTKEELDEDEMQKDEHTIPLFGCNDTLGSDYTVNTERRWAGSGSLERPAGGNPSVSFALPHAVDGTGMDTLQLAWYVSDISTFAALTGGTIRLGSVGGGQLSWHMGAAFATIDAPQSGWNVMSLPLDEARPKGDFDLSRVDSISLRWDDVTFGERTFGIDSIRLTDAQAQLYAAAVARIQSLLDTVAQLNALNATTLVEHNFKQVARTCASLRQDYDALKGADLALANEFGVRDTLIATEQAIDTYERALTAGNARPDSDAPTEPAEPCYPALTPPALPEDDAKSPVTEPNEQTDTGKEAPEENEGGVHPMIAVALVVSVGAAMTAALMIAIKKKKQAKKITETP